MTNVAAGEDPSVLDASTVVRQARTDPESGLSTAEAARRLAEAGPNELRRAEPVPAWRRFVEQFRDPLIYLLFAAIAIALAAWVIEGTSGLPHDAIVISAIVVLNAVLGYAQQAKAEHAVEALRRMGAPTATVIRDGVQVQVPTRDLVPGDILVLAE